MFSVLNLAAGRLPICLLTGDSLCSCASVEADAVPGLAGFFKLKAQLFLNTVVGSLIEYLGDNALKVWKLFVIHSYPRTN